MKSLVAILFLLGAVHAQEFSADLNYQDQTIPVSNQYYPIAFNHLKYNHFAPGAVTINGNDFYFTAPKTGLVRFSGQIYVVLDYTKPMPMNGQYVAKIFKNGACNVGGDVIAGIGSAESIDLWWLEAVQIQGEDFAQYGDVYRWCLYSTGNPTSYIQSHPAHTRITVSMP